MWAGHEYPKQEKLFLSNFPFFSSRIHIGRWIAILKRRNRGVELNLDSLTHRKS